MAMLTPDYPFEKKTNGNSNILLVHGAWADGSCWHKVILLLQAKGYNFAAAQIPLTSLADDVAVVRRLLSMQAAPTVLVGHSYGGAVITGAASAMPQMAGRMNANVRSVAASHAPFMARPQDVAHIIALAAESMSS